MSTPENKKRDYEEVGIQMGYAGDKDGKDAFLTALQGDLEKAAGKLTTSLTTCQTAFDTLESHIQTFVKELYDELERMMELKASAIKNMKHGIINLLPAELDPNERSRVIDDIIKSGIDDISKCQAKIRDIIQDPLESALKELKMHKHLNEIVEENKRFTDTMTIATENIMKINKGFAYGYAIRQQLSDDDE